MISSGINPFITLPVSFICGALAGLVTGLIHVKCKVRDLLSGIITMTILYSINLHIADGKANIPLFNNDSIFSLSPIKGIAGQFNTVIVVLVISLIAKFLLARVETNARCFGALYSRYDHSLFLEFCRRFDVDPKKKIGKLSKGQKARFQLAFAFSHDAKVFLMDEPAAGLDPLFRKELMGYMQEIVEDGTRSILFSTHITEDLDQIGDYILLMDHGRLILDLTREELADRYLLLHGTKEQLEQLDPQMVVCQNFGEYRNSTLIDSAKAESLHLGALTVTRPSLEDLMYCFHKGGVIQ